METGEPAPSVRQAAASDWRSGEERFDLERALAALGETSRLVVWLFHVEGMTHAEIGDALGRSPSFSKSRLSRAHQALRQRLSDPWSHEDAPDDRAVAGTTGG